MRNLLALMAITPLLFAAASCGDDDSGGTDDEAACLSACEATYADDLETCAACGIEVVVEDGACDCYFFSCVSELCAAWCEDQGAAGGTCYLDECSCE